MLAIAQLLDERQRPAMQADHQVSTAHDRQSAALEAQLARMLHRHHLCQEPAADVLQPQLRRGIAETELLCQLHQQRVGVLAAIVLDVDPEQLALGQCRWIDRIRFDRAIVAIGVEQPIARR